MDRRGSKYWIREYYGAGSLPVTEKSVKPTRVHTVGFSVKKYSTIANGYNCCKYTSKGVISLGVRLTSRFLGITTAQGQLKWNFTEGGEYYLCKSIICQSIVKRICKNFFFKKTSSSKSIRLHTAPATGQYGASCLLYNWMAFSNPR